MFGNLARAGVRFGLAAFVLLVTGPSLHNAVAEGETRTLSMRHAHTGDTITVTFKRNGKYDEAALKQLDWFLRDWRRDEAVRMDPQLFDIMWQAYRETGASEPIEIISGYRAPETNSMLRVRSSGVAKFSQHTLGKAIDFFIHGVPLAKLRAVGLKMQRGGVGFYPRSGSPFVHLDVGTVRHWPGISREQLVNIFPDGRTVHIPSDGQPLPGFTQAMADLERRGDVPSGRTLQLAHAAGVITDHQMQVAELAAQRQQEGSLLALANSNDDEDAGRAGAPLVLASLKATRPAPATPRVQLASAEVVRAAPVPMPQGRPKLMTLASVESKPLAAPVTTASVTENIFDKRFWPGPIESEAVSAAQFRVASADLSPTGSTGNNETLAYAPDDRTAAPETAPQPMGQRLRGHLPRLVTPAWAGATDQPLTMETKSLLGTPMAIGDQRLSSPWTRAAVLTPSVSGSMTVSQLVGNDPRLFRDLLYKPARAVVMGFADDPQSGMTSGRFSGDAVVFVTTTRFVPQQTASLR